MDEELRGSGPTDDESLTQMYRSFCKEVLAAARRHNALKAVGMTGKYWEAQEIASEERDRDDLMKRLGIHSEEYKAKDRNVRGLTSERKAEKRERKVTRAKEKKVMRSNMRSFTTN